MSFIRSDWRQPSVEFVDVFLWQIIINEFTQIIIDGTTISYTPGSRGLIVKSGRSWHNMLTIYIILNVLYIKGDYLFMFYTLSTIVHEKIMFFI